MRYRPKSKLKICLSVDKIIKNKKRKTYPMSYYRICTMIFKDRRDAGKQLAEAIIKDQTIMIEKEQLVVASILRGGVLVGYEIAKQLSIPHLFLAVAKISHPDNKELAIGAVCNGAHFLDTTYINRVRLPKKEVNEQIDRAIKKQKKYREKFMKEERLIKNKSVIIVDDGIATGASVRSAAKYIKKELVSKIILAVPVAPSDFDISVFDRTIILQKVDFFHAVSQSYFEFHQVSDQEILKMEALN